MLDARKTVVTAPQGVEEAAMLPAAIRAIFARLSGRMPARRVDGPASRPDPRSGARLQRVHAEAHAAFRSAERGGTGALDAALAVYEAEVLRWRTAAEAYGEALKAVRIYSRDPLLRSTAAAAMAATPMPMRRAQPVPKLALAGGRECQDG
jgi:hypothetical protein